MLVTLYFYCSYCAISEATTVTKKRLNNAMLVIYDTLYSGDYEEIVTLTSDENKSVYVNNQTQTVL